MPATTSQTPRLPRNLPSQTRTPRRLRAPRSDRIGTPSGSTSCSSPEPWDSFGVSSLAGGGLPCRLVLALHGPGHPGVDLVERRLRARDEALALLPELLVRVALAGVERAQVGDEPLGGLDLVREVARGEILVQGCHLARPGLQRQALAMQRDQAPAENAGEMDDRVGMDDADAALDAEVPYAGGKDGGDEDGRRGLVARLVGTQLRDEVRAPRLVILGIVDDAAAPRALVPHILQDVGAELAAADPLKGVVAERGAEVGLEIALGAVAELVRGLLLERPLQLLGPALQALVLAIRLRLHLQEGAVVVDLQDLALTGQTLVLACRQGRDLTLVLLSQLTPRLGLARREARSLLLADPLLDGFVFSPRDRLTAERAFLAAFHGSHSWSVVAARAVECLAYHSRMRARWRSRRAYRAAGVSVRRRRRRGPSRPDWI